MGRKHMPGLYQRGGIWHIDKQFRGQRLCESTGTSDLKEAQEYLISRLEAVRRATIYGVRPDRTFRQAATRYLEDEMRSGALRCLSRNAQALAGVEPHIGDLPLRLVHMGTLTPYIQKRQAKGIKSGTLRRDLAVVRRVLNLAARLWRDENGLSWLETPPLIQMPKATDARAPYPLAWEEQRLLLSALPVHLQRMALFKVNTGTREHEVCSLRWDWEVPVPELETSVFLIPSRDVKNGEERLVVLNRIARSVVEGERGRDAEFVFTYRGRAVTKIYNSAWKRARRDAAARYKKEFKRLCPDGFRQLRVHDLKHTFGRRLRAAGVSLEDREDLLGHKSARMTTHYSSAELERLIEAAEKVCGQGSRKSPALVVLKRLPRAGAHL